MTIDIGPATVIISIFLICVTVAAVFGTLYASEPSASIEACNSGCYTRAWDDSHNTCFLECVESLNVDLSEEAQK